jgi:hypothetical protein
LKGKNDHNHELKEKKSEEKDLTFIEIFIRREKCHHKYLLFIAITVSKMKGR